ncbi:PKD domain-containing protein [Methanolobus zinderi]|uniref:PKD domain-containing protein n=1 Tax=Methanolobus zinderi TaxID=536044 RepID=A0A7D5E8Z3_9EURY|nr:PKD domain-containing protein [Methanolobus zinderi]QLC49735.1 PKD domain-containing protein [Methanolobus zinderi]
MLILSFLCIGIVNAADDTTETPVASFSADVTEGKVPLEVQFTDTSSGDPTSWEWDFGDGETSDSQNASHVYTEAGAFDVSLTVSNANESNSVTEVGYISTNTIPVVDIDYIRPNPAIEGDTVSLVGIYVYNYTAITRGNHEWYSYLEERVICPGRTLYTGNLEVGNHTISFRAKDSEDQWSDPVYGSVLILENNPPEASIDSITPNHALKGEEVTFIGSGTDDDGVVNGSIIHEYKWESSIDGMLSTSNQSSFSSSNMSVGTHTITLKVKDHMSSSLPVSATLIVKGDTEYIQVSSEKAISANNPVNIVFDVNDTNLTSLEFSITDSNDAVILTKDITDELDSGIYSFEWDATDSQGEPLQSGAYKLSLLGTDSFGDSISEGMILNVDHTPPVIVIDDITGVITHEDIVYASSDLTVTISGSGYI